MSDKKWLWHRRLGHANWRLISKLSKLQLVSGLPDIDYHSDALCGACQKGKIVKTSFKSKDIDYHSDALCGAIRLLLSYAVNHNIILYQMDVKSAFLNGVISEEVFGKQPLYGLKQAPRACYDRLSNFLLKNDFKRGHVDTTLFKKTLEKDILIVQIYVDDIIFGSTNASLCNEFSKLM